MLFHVETQRINAYHSIAKCKSGAFILDTGNAASHDAFNPAELLLTALSACIVKGVERVIPVLKFGIREVVVTVKGVRHESPPRIKSIHYEIVVDTDESDQRLDQLHENIKKYSTVLNTLASSAELTGNLIRKGWLQKNIPLSTL